MTDLTGRQLEQFLDEARSGQFTDDELGKRWLIARETACRTRTRNGIFRNHNAKYEERLNAVFNALAEAAAAGRACPDATEAPLFVGAFTALARRGMILVGLSRGNTGEFRQITILTGPHAGKQTAPDQRGIKPHIVVGKDTRIHGVPLTKQRRRPVPSSPADIMQRRLEARA